MRMYSRAICAALIAGSAAVTQAQAGYIVTLEEVGTDVVATGSGPIDLAGLTFFTPSAFPANVQPLSGVILTGPASFTAFSVYLGITGPASFGSSPGTVADSGSGDPVGIAGGGGQLGVPVGYVSGNPLSDTSTYLNQTFASLGVTPGTYEWTWGRGANQNFTLEIGAVPEPASLVLLGSALLGFGVMRRRRRKSV